MDIRDFLTKNGIEWRVKGKNLSGKYIGINCPFCNDTTYHGGINPKTPLWYSCWRCGNFRIEKVISSLLKISWNAAAHRVRESELTEEYQEAIEKKPFSLPEDCHSMRKRHKDYLRERGFDPDFLEKEYGLLGTGQYSDYPNRVIVPVNCRERTVSFIGRDISGEQSARYKACAEEKEVIHYKKLLYNYDRAVLQDRCIVVEGVTGVWKLGKHAVATFGIRYTPEQLKLLIVFKKIIVFFDSDPKARIFSERLCNSLETFGIKTENYFLDDGRDSGELTQEEVKEIIHDLFKEK